MYEPDGTAGSINITHPLPPPLLLYAEKEHLDPTSWYVPPHNHEHHEVLILVEGAQRTRVDGTDRIATSGQVFVYGAGRQHEEWLLPDREVEKYTLGFKWEGELAHLPPLVHDAGGRLTELAAWIAAESPSPEEMKSGIYEPLLHAFVGEIFRAAARTGQELKLKAQQVVRSEMPAMSGVVDLARAMGMSRSHFSRRFTEETGQSPSDFLRAERLLRARHLLRNTKMAVKEVAAAVGVSSEQQLCRMVRQNYGVTTRQLRGASC